VARALAHPAKPDVIVRRLPTLLLALALGAAPWPCAARGQGPAPARSPEGHWQGTLQGTLRLVVHVIRTSEGRFGGTLDSPDQGAAGLALDALTFTGDSLRFSMRRIGGEFAGAMSADGAKIDGQWRQSGLALPLVLERLASAPEARRPQEPREPYPYAADTVRVSNRKSGVSLAGTLTVPSGAGPFPCAILITGSGPEDRDEKVFGHRPFLVLADHLARHGIAALRLDDRGVGASSGDFSRATSLDFADDALAALDFLSNRRGIDARRIGLIGHSEGGLIAPLVATRSRNVAWIVLLAGTGVPGDSVLSGQVERIARAAGVDAAVVAAESRLQRQILIAVREERDSAAVTLRVRQLVRARLAELPEAQRKGLGDPDALADAQLRVLRSPWMSFFLTYDPRPTLGKVRCPVLALNGEKDVQVDARQNLAAIEEALRGGGNRDFAIRQLPGLNHLFQTAGSGATAEYAAIEETMAPIALEAVTTWIQAHGVPRR